MEDFILKNFAKNQDKTNLQDTTVKMGLNAHITENSVTDNIKLEPNFKILDFNFKIRHFKYFDKDLHQMLQEYTVRQEQITTKTMKQVILKLNFLKLNFNNSQHIIAIIDLSTYFDFNSVY